MEFFVHLPYLAPNNPTKKKPHRRRVSSLGTTIHIQKKDGISVIKTSHHATDGINCSSSSFGSTQAFSVQYVCRLCVEHVISHEPWRQKFWKTLYNHRHGAPHPRLRGVETLPNTLVSGKAASLNLDKTRRPLDGGNRHGRKLGVWHAF